MKEFTASENYVNIGEMKRLLSIAGSSNCETVRFTVNRYCGDIDLSQCSCTIKTKNSAGKSDVILPQILSSDDKIEVLWTVSSASTSVAGKLLAQIQFEKIFDDSTKDIVWQSNIMEFEIAESLKSADEVYEQNPTLFQQWEERVDTAYSSVSSSVETAKNCADTAAASAQAAQLQAVAAKADAERTQQTAANFTGYTKQESDRLFANALVGKAVGRPVIPDDIRSGSVLCSLTFCGETAESGSGTKSPDNPYSLSGSGLAQVSGKNLININTAAKLNIAAVTDSVITTSLLAGYAVFGLGIGSGISMQTPIPITGNCPITYSFKLKLLSGSYSAALNYIRLAVSKTASGTGTTISPLTAVNPVVTSDYKLYSATFSIPAGYRYCGPILQVTSAASGAVFQITDFQVEYGLAATAFEPYKGIQSFAFPRALFSLPDGTSDTYEAISGLLTQKIHSGAISASSWAIAKDYFDSSIIGFLCHPSDRADGTAVNYCNKLPIEATGTPTKNKELLWYAGGIGVAILKSRLTGWDENLTDAQKTALFTTWLANNPITALYKLAKQATVQSAGQNITPYVPVSALTADSGSVSVEYYRDVSLVIQKLEANIAALRE